MVRNNVRTPARPGEPSRTVFLTVADLVILPLPGSFGESIGVAALPVLPLPGSFGEAALRVLPGSGALLGGSGKATRSVARQAFSRVRPADARNVLLVTLSVTVWEGFSRTFDDW